MHFVLSASVFLHRDGEILILKRAGGFAGGGWFIPGGHVEFGESPLEAVVRETREECAIELPPESLQLVGVTTFFPTPDEQHHGVIYLAACPPGAGCVLNEEHVGYRWVRPDYYVSRFLTEERLVAAGLAEPLLRTTRETRRVAEAVIALLAGEAGGPHSP